MRHIYQRQGVEVGPEGSLTGPRGSVVSSSQCPSVWELGCVGVLHRAWAWPLTMSSSVVL